MWQADQYPAFDKDLGDQCARATGMVTKWLVEML